MILDDPNDPQDPEGSPPEPQQPEPPAPPAPIDLNAAYDAISQAEGWDPRLTRYEIDEVKRKRAELDRERREFEAERSRQYQAPQEDPNADPYMRRMDRIERLFVEDREEKRREREQQALIGRLGTELNQTYTSLARQAGMSKEQLDAQSEEFYATLNELYPTPGMLHEMGVQNAARNAFRLIKQNGGRTQSYYPQVNGRGPTATRTIPGSPQPYIPGSGVPIPQEELTVEHLPGETDQQRLARLERIFAAANVRGLPDGMKVQSRG